MKIVEFVITATIKSGDHRKIAGLSTVCAVIYWLISNNYKPKTENHCDEFIITHLIKETTTPLDHWTQAHLGS